MISVLSDVASIDILKWISLEIQAKNMACKEENKGGFISTPLSPE